MQDLFYLGNFDSAGTHFIKRSILRAASRQILIFSDTTFSNKIKIMAVAFALSYDMSYDNKIVF